MRSGVIAQKVGMTRVFTETGEYSAVARSPLAAHSVPPKR